MGKMIDWLLGRGHRKTERFPNCRVMPTAFVDAASEIGEYTFVGEGALVTRATIGRYCSIAPHVKIGLGEHDVKAVSTSAFLNPKCDYAHLTEKECVIGSDVWIGVDAIVRRGVRIGNCAVVGANSFVNRDVPDFAIAVGSPARVVGYRFDEERRRKIAESRYWECDLETARKRIGEL